MNVFLKALSVFRIEANVRTKEINVHLFYAGLFFYHTL